MFQCLRLVIGTNHSCNHPRGSFFRRYFHITAPSTSKRSYYEILGVKNTASSAEIRDAFVNLSKKYHPDVNKDDKNAHERFVEINEAYSVLSKNDSRRDYDSKLRQGQIYDTPPSSPRSDPTRDLYKQYYDQLHRQRREAAKGFSRFDEQFQNRHPFRDFWQEFSQSYEQQEQQRRRPSPQAKLDEQANKMFYMFFLAVFTLTLIVHFLQYAMVRPGNRPYDYGDIDNSLRQWRNVVIVDRPEEKQPERPPLENRDRHIVEA